jgi:hypothetical protein
MSHNTFCNPSTKSIRKQSLPRSPAFSDHNKCQKKDLRQGMDFLIEHAGRISSPFMGTLLSLELQSERTKSLSLLSLL